MWLIVQHVRLNDHSSSVLGTSDITHLKWPGDSQVLISTSKSELGKHIGDNVDQTSPFGGFRHPGPSI